MIRPRAAASARLPARPAVVLAALASLVGLALGCPAKNNGTLLLVDIDTDLDRALLDRIEVEVRPARGQGASQSFPLTGSSGPPFRLAVVPRGDPALEVEIVARAMLDSREVVRLAAALRFEAGAARAANLLLSADCIDTKPRDCPGAEQCVAGGACVAKRLVATLRPLGRPRTRPHRRPTPPWCPMAARARWTPIAIGSRATWG